MTSSSSQDDIDRSEKIPGYATPSHPWQEVNAVNWNETEGASVNERKTRSRSQSERLSRIHDWLSAPDPSLNYHKALRQRQAGTGLWLLQDEKFKIWKEAAASRLLLYGISGCGKTILSSTIIEHLLFHCHDDVRMVTVYFYFDINDTQKQDSKLMLQSLLSQLLLRSEMIPESVDTLISSCGNGQRQPSLYELLEALSQVLQQFTHVYLILDALNECKQGGKLVDVLEAMDGWQLDNLHLLMTGRQERPIDEFLGRHLKEGYSICLHRNVVDQDILRYVLQRLGDERGLPKWNGNADIMREILTAVMRDAGGMYVYISVQ